MTTRAQLLILITAALAAGGCASTKSASSSGGSAGAEQSSSSGSGASGTGASSSPAGLPGGTGAMPSAGTAPVAAPGVSPATGQTSTGGASASVPTASGSEPGASGSAGSGPAQTPDERRAALDRRLDDSLGSFDAELRREQEELAKERDARDAANAGSAEAGDESDSSETDSSDGTGESGSGTNEDPVVASTGPETQGRSGENGTDRAGRPGDLKSEKQRGETTSAGGSGTSGSAALKIPDGSDDDIVARRLRKAAEQETDPELKEKLWKEYIEYKKNNG